MNATAEIDKAGRLVVPKKLRDALHFAPGTRIAFHQEGDSLVLQLEAKPRGLYWKDGMPVYEFGRPLPPDHIDWVEQSRDERIEALWKLGQKD